MKEKKETKEILQQNAIAVEKREWRHSLIGFIVCFAFGAPIGCLTLSYFRGKPGEVLYTLIVLMLMIILLMPLVNVFICEYRIRRIREGKIRIVTDTMQSKEKPLTYFLTGRLNEVPFMNFDHIGRFCVSKQYHELASLGDEFIIVLYSKMRNRPTLIYPAKIYEYRGEKESA